MALNTEVWTSDKFKVNFLPSRPLATTGKKRMVVQRAWAISKEAAQQVALDNMDDMGDAFANVFKSLEGYFFQMVDEGTITDMNNLLIQVEMGTQLRNLESGETVSLQHIICTEFDGQTLKLFFATVLPEEAMLFIKERQTVPHLQ